METDSVSWVCANRYVQIHPTRYCNLRCQHCYTLSSPDEREEIDAWILQEALSDAAREGFNIANFSGGEPTLYSWLPITLDHAHGCGLSTVIVSNGTVLTRPRLAMLRDKTDLLAISLDGVPASHNSIRGSARAFDMMRARLDDVRSSGIPFGFIFLLTRENIHELDWVAQFALDQGARLLQVHPLEDVGRASDEMQGRGPSDRDCEYTQLVLDRIRRLAGNRMIVHLDAAHRAILRLNGAMTMADSDGSADVTRPLAELLPTLVIEADGTVTPLVYGLSRRYALGNLKQAPLRDLIAAWRGEGCLELRDLCRTVFAEVTESCLVPYVNWWEVLRRRSLQIGNAQLAHQ
ncbi:MAG TPA: radical SAM protein [Candidatus Binataceae bacterium]|nr:radical SAM protein [Candidatus Binataceae bacterium]